MGRLQGPASCPQCDRVKTPGLTLNCFGALESTSSCRPSVHSALDVNNLETRCQLQIVRFLFRTEQKVISPVTERWLLGWDDDQSSVSAVEAGAQRLKPLAGRPAFSPGQGQKTRSPRTSCRA